MHHRRALTAATLAVALAATGVSTMPAAASEEPLYDLPVANGSALTVWQGVGEGPGRTPDETLASGASQ